MGGADSGVPVAVIGNAGGTDVAVAGLFDVPLATLRSANEAWMPKFMG